MEIQDFVTDIFFPDMLFCITIRSPIAKGKLVSINCPKLPEGYMLLTAKDIPGKNFLYDTSMPILADDDLSYIGEPVALLLGPERDMLEEFVKECKLITKKEKPVFFSSTVNETMATVKRKRVTGDPHNAFLNADSVIKDKYTSGIQEHWYAETISAVTYFDTNKNRKNLTVKTASQWPNHVKHSVAAMLGTAASKIIFKEAHLGLPLDGKQWYPSLIACQAALCTWLTKKPVRLTLTRGEDFMFSPKRFAAEIDMESAFDENAELLGLKIKAYVNLGSYGVYADEIMDNVYLGCLGIYDIKNIDFEAYGIMTNIPPQGAFAGFGLAQGNFAFERHISQKYEKSNLNPIEWRKKNVLKQKMLPAKLPLNDAFPSLNLINSVSKMSGFERKWAAYSLMSKSFSRESINKGIGIALGYHGNGLLHYDPNIGKKRLKHSNNEIWNEHFSLNENDIIDYSSFSHPAFIAAVVEIEIDPIEIIPNIRGVWLCVDGGKIIDKDKAVWNLKAATVQALCWAYNERLSYIEGVIPIEQFDNFDIIAPLKIPPINIEFLESSADEKDLGNLPFTCIPAAYLQAVSQTMEYHFKSIPLKALDILGRK